MLALFAAVALRQLLLGRDMRWMFYLGQAQKSTWSERTWAWAGFGIVLLTLGALEWRAPFYFSQDDNHSQFLPVVVLAMRQFFATGVLPVWNAYQDFGMTLVTGGYALTYPPLYLCYLAARALGNEYLMLDLLGWMHFLAGYWLMWLALRRLGVGALLAAAGALSYVLAGVNIALASSWITNLMLPAYFPLILLSLVSLWREPRVSRRWIAVTGISFGLLFHVGHAQFWIYGVILWGTGVLWLLATAPRGARLHTVLAASAAVLLMSAIAAPLMVPQYILQADLAPVQWSDGPWDMLNAMLLPKPLAMVPPFSYMPAAADFYGGIPAFATLAFAVFFVALACARPLARSEWRAGVLIVSTVVAFLWMLGDRGPIWNFMAAYPPFSRFTAPFKIMALVVLFSIAAGAQFLQALMMHKPHLRPAIWGAIAVWIAASVYNAFLCEPRYRFADRPYPAAPDAIAPLRQGEGRAMVAADACRSWYIAADRSQVEGYAYSLVNNYASVYGIFSANRYTQRITWTPNSGWAAELAHRDVDAFLREYGICAVLTPNMNIGRYCVGGVRPSRFTLSFEERDYKVNHVTPVSPFMLYDVRMTHLRPLVFFQDKPEQGLPFIIRADGLEIIAPRANEHERRLVINFLHHAWFHAFTESGQELAVEVDPYRRMAVNVPGGNTKLLLQYRPPWKEGFMLAGVLLIAAACCAALYQRCCCRLSETTRV